jgi:predicted transcriptional regulator
MWDTVPEIARSVGWSEHRIRKLLRNGTIEGQKLGDMWLTTVDAVLETVRVDVSRGTVT